MDYHPGASAPFPLDEGQLRSILATENGRKLLLLLQKTDPAALRDAAKAAKAGDYVAVQRILGPFLQSPEANALFGAGRKPWTICNLRSSSCSPIRSSSRSWPRWRQRSGCIRPKAARRPSRRRNRRNRKIKSGQMRRRGRKGQGRPCPRATGGKSC